MPDFAALAPATLIPQMLQTAAGIAGPAWDDIKDEAKHEFTILGQRIREIAKAVADGEMSMAGSRILFRMAKRNLISTLAMLTIMVEAAAQKLVNGVIKALKDHLNTAIGFALL